MGPASLRRFQEYLNPSFPDQALPPDSRRPERSGTLAAGRGLVLADFPLALEPVMMTI